MVLDVAAQLGRLAEQRPVPLLPVLVELLLGSIDGVLDRSGENLDHGTAYVTPPAVASRWANRAARGQRPARGTPSSSRDAPRWHSCRATSAAGPTFRTGRCLRWPGTCGSPRRDTTGRSRRCPADTSRD